MKCWMMSPSWKSELFQICRGKISMVLILQLRYRDANLIPNSKWAYITLWCGDMYRMSTKFIPPRVVVKAAEKNGPCHVLTFPGIKRTFCWPLSRLANYTASEMFVSSSNLGKICREKKGGLEWKPERDMKQKYREKVWANQHAAFRASSAQMGFWWRSYCAGIG